MLFGGGERNLLFLEKPHLSHVLIKNPTAVTARPEAHTGLRGPLRQQEASSAVVNNHNTS